MPIIWRYLLGRYLKVLCFCIVSFIAVLLTTRLQEIADFASSGAQFPLIVWFTIYQIPYILPIAVPISCLISAILLVTGLSASYELTALRSSGMALRHILTPLLLAGSCVALFNFYVASELATSSHLKSRVLEDQLRSVNPLLLLDNNHLAKFRGIYINAMGPTQVGESVTDLLVALPNKKSKRINLIFAKNIHLESTSLFGDRLTLINSDGVDRSDQADHLFVENIDKITTSSKDLFNNFNKKGGARIKTDYLKLSLLLVRTEEDLQALQAVDPKDKPLLTFYKKRTVKNITEILRRVDLGLAPFTFTLMGIAFGISIGRRNSYRGILWVTILATLFMFGYFAGKGVSNNVFPAALFFLAPHVIIVASSLRALKNVSKGIE
jgi:lipopolysaccharide export system permease protein